jgi:hypothetical protein
MLSRTGLYQNAGLVNVKSKDSEGCGILAAGYSNHPGERSHQLVASTLAFQLLKIGTAAALVKARNVKI